MSYSEDIKKLGFIAATKSRFKSSYPSDVEVKEMYSSFTTHVSSLDLSKTSADDILALGNISQSFLSSLIKQNYQVELSKIKDFLQDKSIHDPRMKDISYNLENGVYNLYYKDSSTSFLSIPRKSISAICKEYVGLENISPLLVSLTLQESENLVQAYINLKIRLALSKKN